MLKNRILPVLAGAVVVVAGVNVASYAANGHALLLGRSNSESATATVTNAGKGPALSLKSSGKFPSLAVSSSKKVAHLNADAVDGLDSRVLGRAYSYRIPSATALPYTLQMADLPKGRYAVSFNIASTAATGPITPFCNIADSTSQYAVVSFGQSDPVGNGIAINSASGTVDVKGKGQAAVECSGADTTYEAGGSKNVIVFTPLAKVTSGTLTPLAPPAPKHGSHAFGR